MGEGATLVNVSRDLFMSFVASKPRTLQIYLHKARPTALCFHAHHGARHVTRWLKVEDPSHQITEVPLRGASLAERKSCRVQGPAQVRGGICQVMLAARSLLSLRALEGVVARRRWHASGAWRTLR